jgi:hypothetical protein
MPARARSPHRCTTKFAIPRSGPQSIPAMVTNKAIDLVPEVTSPDVHRLMPHELAAGDGPTGSLPQRPGASNIMMPHGAFP